MALRPRWNEFAKRSSPLGPTAAALADIQRNVLRTLVLALLSLVTGCQIFGDFEIAQSSATCTSGQVQCVGTVLQNCNRQGNGWENASVCASETLCDKTRGVCKEAVCAAGERRCLEAELQICNGTRDGWLTLATCASAGHCSTQAGGCMDIPCQPGDFQCSGATLQACKADQSGWEDRGACPAAALCNEVEGKCDDGLCSAGQFQCVGAELQTCSPTFDAWTTIQVCDSPGLCNATTGACGQGSCSTPGVFRCKDDGALERCPDDLVAWTPVDNCESVAHCDAVAGTCMAEPCEPGKKQCSGALLQSCRSDRSGWDLVGTCETDALCQRTLSDGSDQCVEPACDAEEVQCNGAQPQICNAGRTGFRDNGAACASASLCKGVSGTCEPPVCQPDEGRCTEAQPELCNAEQTGYIENGPPCASIPLCNAETGSCNDAVCQADETRCDPLDPTVLQRCNATLDGWIECDICATAELCSASRGAVSCDATACQEPTCAVTDMWCGGPENKELHKCPDSRINSQPVVLDTCETGGLCEQTHDAGEATCREPTCALTDLWCGGTGSRQLFKCPASRINSEATVLATCETSGLCEQAHSQGRTTCPAPACAVGQFQCGGTGNRTLRQCRSDRTGYQDCDVCDSAALCTDSLGATTCNTSACHACVAGQKACNGSQLQVCNAAGSGFTNLELCGSSALCTSSLTPASQMTCDTCVGGSHACDGAQPQLCSDPGTGPSVWVDDGDACDAAGLCNPSTGTCTCALGETRCNPTTDNFEECGMAGWAETEVCTAGCDDTAGCSEEAEE